MMVSLLPPSNVPTTLYSAYFLVLSLPFLSQVLTSTTRLFKGFSASSDPLRYADILSTSRENFDYSIGLEEIDEIISRTFESNRKSGKNEYKKKKTIIPAYKSSTSANNYNKEKLLIVDGYNIIFAWDELKYLSDINIDSAKDRLIHILSNYHGITEIKIILVFDGYKVKGNQGSEELLNDIHVIHTKEHETADLFIEQFTNKNRLNYKITVASSDGLIQQITRGQDCNILSARDLLNVINNEHEEFRKNYNIE